VKSAARRAHEREAADVLGGGYFQSPSPSEVYAFCRRCRHKVQAKLPHGKRGAGPATRVLIEALANHLEDEHPDGLE